RTAALRGEPDVMRKPITFVAGGLACLAALFLTGVCHAQTATGTVTGGSTVTGGGSLTGDGSLTGGGNALGGSSGLGGNRGTGSNSGGTIIGNNTTFVGSGFSGGSNQNMGTNTGTARTGTARGGSASGVLTTSFLGTNAKNPLAQGFAGGSVATDRFRTNMSPLTPPGPPPAGAPPAPALPQPTGHPPPGGAPARPTSRPATRGTTGSFTGGTTGVTAYGGEGGSIRPPSYEARLLGPPLPTVSLSTAAERIRADVAGSITASNRIPSRGLIQ